VIDRETRHHVPGGPDDPRFVYRKWTAFRSPCPARDAGGESGDAVGAALAIAREVDGAARIVRAVDVDDTEALEPASYKAQTRLSAEDEIVSYTNDGACHAIARLTARKLLRSAISLPPTSMTCQAVPFHHRQHRRQAVMRR
jgi:hypothetical protein